VNVEDVPQINVISAAMSGTSRWTPALVAETGPPRAGILLTRPIHQLMRFKKDHQNSRWGTVLNRHSLE
jgi:hypothetical protein